MSEPIQELPCKAYNTNHRIISFNFEVKTANLKKGKRQTKRSEDPKRRGVFPLVLRFSPL
jgi:hypothetical protein